MRTTAATLLVSLLFMQLLVGCASVGGQEKAGPDASYMAVAAPIEVRDCLIEQTGKSLFFSAVSVVPAFGSGFRLMWNNDARIFVAIKPVDEGAVIEKYQSQPFMGMRALNRALESCASGKK